MKSFQSSLACKLKPRNNDEICRCRPNWMSHLEKAQKSAGFFCPLQSSAYFKKKNPNPTFESAQGAQNPFHLGNNMKLAQIC